MNFNFLKNKGTPISENDLRKIEKYYNINFPEILRDFYLNCFGAAIEEKTILQNSSIDLSIARFIYPSINSDSLFSILINDKFKDYDNLNGYVPLASDWGDDILFWNSTNGQVVVSYADSDDPVFICDNLDQFFKLMNNNETERQIDMKNTNILPLGSIVILNGGTEKLLIVSRAINVNNKGKSFFFDYGGVHYPAGLISDQMAYFNSENIEKVIFEGYSDVDNDIIVERINEYIDSNPTIIKGNADNWEI